MLDLERVLAYLRTASGFYSRSQAEMATGSELLRQMDFSEGDDSMDEKLALLRQVLRSEAFWQPVVMRGTFHRDLQHHMIDVATRELPGDADVVKAWVVFKLCTNGTEKERVVFLTSREVIVVTVKMNSNGQLKAKRHRPGPRTVIPLDRVEAIVVGPTFLPGEEYGSNTGKGIRVTSIGDHLNPASNMPRRFAVRLHYAAPGQGPSLNEPASGGLLPSVAPSASEDPRARQIIGSLSHSISFCSPLYTRPPPAKESGKAMLETGWAFTELIANEIGWAVYHAACCAERVIPKPLSERVKIHSGFRIFSKLHNAMNAGVCSAHPHLI